MKKTLVGAIALLSSLALPASALEIATDGGWYAFDVDELTSVSGGVEWIDLDGNPLAFSFSLVQGGVLRVVDAGFRGDRFEVIDADTLLTLTQTSVVANPDVMGDTPETDFDAAFSDHAVFSYLELVLAPGSYNLTGLLSQSAIFDGAALNATFGALSVTAVPLPASGFLLLGAGGLLRSIARRRRA